MFGLMPFLLFSGCGDLEPEMQDTRTVVLKMNFNQRSSSRSSQISQAEVSNHKTHLILALPAWENLNSNYRNYYSSFAQELMNPSDNKVSLEIPLNTQMRIFAFLFSEEYTKPQLLSGVREVGYYGQSEPFSIGTNTNNLRLNITLQSATTSDGEDDGEDSTGDGNQGGTDSTAPSIEQVTPIASPTNDSTPNYTFASTEAGAITYGGPCSSGITSAVSGNNTITFIALSDGTYYDCTITVTDYEGNVSNTLTVTAFTIDTTALDTTAPTVSFSPANGTTDIGVSGNITITFSEAVRNIDNAVLTDSHINSHIKLKLNNASGNNINFDATINGNKTVITINPTSNLPNSQVVYVAIGATLEDHSDNPITAANASFTTVMDPSLEAYYQFNGDAEDLTSNGRNFTIYDNTSLTTGRDNSSNSAYYFDGSGDYLEYNTSIPAFSECTISLWAKPDSTGNYKSMFASYDSSGNGFQIDFSSNNFRINSSATGGTINLGQATINVWTFIAFTYDGNNSVGYINDNNSSSSGGTCEINRFRIGRNRNGEQYFHGAIDELRIYNRALSASEIQAIYSN